MPKPINPLLHHQQVYFFQINLNVNKFYPPLAAICLRIVHAAGGAPHHICRLYCLLAHRARPQQSYRKHTNTYTDTHTDRRSLMLLHSIPTEGCSVEPDTVSHLMLLSDDQRGHKAYL